MSASDSRALRFVQQPVHERLGLRFVSRTGEGAEVALPLRPEHLQIDGVVHGGVLATLMDTAAVYSIHPGLEGDATITSVEFKINFLRPATLARGDVLARARVLKVGRTVAVSEVELLQAGELAAKGLFTYLVLRGRAVDA